MNVLHSIFYFDLCFKLYTRMARSLYEVLQGNDTNWYALYKKFIFKKCIIVAGAIVNCIWAGLKMLSICISHVIKLLSLQLMITGCAVVYHCVIKLASIFIKMSL